MEQTYMDDFKTAYCYATSILDGDSFDLGKFPKRIKSLIKVALRNSKEYKKLYKSYCKINNISCTDDAVICF